MDVPLFPRPPAIGGVTTPLSDVPSVATLPRVPVSAAASVSRVRERYAVPLRSSSGTKKRRRVFRNLVHPRVKTAALVKDAACRRITEFRMRMTEHRAKDDEGDDDDDVVCGIGRCYLNFSKPFQLIDILVLATVKINTEANLGIV